MPKIFVESAASPPFVQHAEPTLKPHSWSGRHHKSRSALVLASVAILALTGCSPGSTQVEGPSDVGMTMFQWNWESIAEQCTDSLGPAKIGWVLTSPPQEHIQGQEWWTSYQPVSYLLESRLGSEEDFKNMVSTCNDAGVEIIADAVINHMTGQEAAGVGTGGSVFEHYEYPGIYGKDDFHQCGSPNNDIAVYTDARQVQNCELVNLADLKTESSKVQEQLAGYLNHLLELGVSGFRIDAAKHMPAADIKAILDKVEGGPVIIQEVIRGAGEPITPEQYLGNGAVFEFSWGKDMKTLQQGSTFSAFFKAGGKATYAPTESAYTFVENHDTERNGSTLNYKDPQYQVFTALTLASDYGTPVLYSGYAFSEHDAGASVDPTTGLITHAQCSAWQGSDQQFEDGTYTCQQDWPTIRNMVSWRVTAANAPVVEQWSEGDGLAFAREAKTFIAVNRSDEPLTGSWKTTLPAGQYCDGGSGTTWTTECTEPTVTVSKDGTIAGTIPAYGVIALSIDQRS